MKVEKIAMFLDQAFPPDVRVEKEAVTLIKAGFHVDLFSTNYVKVNKSDEYKGIKVHRYFFSKFVYKLSALAYTFPLYHHYLGKKIKRFIESVKPDFLHVHDMVIARAVVDINQKYFNLPLILDLHENRPSIMELYAHVNKPIGKILIKLETWKKEQIKLEKQADRVILVTREAKDNAVRNEGIDGNKIFVVPNTVVKDYGKIENLNNLKERFKDKFNLLYIGDTALRRGTDTFIKCIAELKKNNLFFNAIIVGKSSEDSLLRKLTEDLNVEDLVYFEGWQEEKLLPYYIDVCHIGVCPFRRNLHHDTTYANKLFQYMSFGKPVLGSDCLAQKHLVEKYECGLVFEAEDYREMCAKAKFLYENPENYKKYSENALKSIREELNWEMTSQALVNMYRKL